MNRNILGNVLKKVGRGGAKEQYVEARNTKLIVMLRKFRSTWMMKTQIDLGYAKDESYSESTERLKIQLPQICSTNLTSSNRSWIRTAARKDVRDRAGRERSC